MLHELLLLLRLVLELLLELHRPDHPKATQYQLRLSPFLLLARIPAHLLRTLPFLPNLQPNPILQPFLPQCIVDRTQLWIRQDLISSTDASKGLLSGEARLFGTLLVRVKDESEGAEGGVDS
jgi:hypothetical protein